MKKYRHLLPVAAVAAVSVLLSACGQEKSSSASVEAPESASAFLLADPPAEAPGLLEGLATAAPGDTVLVSGRVGGMRDPLSSDFALFVLADESLEFCDEMADDHCKSPWDACCEPPEKIAAARAVVQFVDASGEPLAVNLGESVGLAANDHVIIRGRLAPDAGDGNRVILAEGVAIQR